MQPVLFGDFVVDVFAEPAGPLPPVEPFAGGGEGFRPTRTTGDQNGSILRKLHSLYMAGDVTFPSGVFNGIREAYRLKSTTANRVTYRAALSKVVWRGEVYFRDMCDDLADRGGGSPFSNDGHMLDLDMAMHEAGVPYCLMGSNHSLIALQRIFGFEEYAIPLDFAYVATMWRLLNPIKQGEDCGYTLDEIKRLLRTAYLPYLRLVDYDLDATGKLTVYSHAPIDLNVLIDFAIHLGVLRVDIDRLALLTVLSINSYELAKLLDGINLATTTHCWLDKFPAEAIGLMLNGTLTYPNSSFAPKPAQRSEPSALWACFIALRRFTFDYTPQFGVHTFVHGHTPGLGHAQQFSLDSRTGANDHFRAGFMPQHHSFSSRPFARLTAEQCAVMFPDRADVVLRAKFPGIEQAQITMINGMVSELYLQVIGRDERRFNSFCMLQKEEFTILNIIRHIPDDPAVLARLPEIMAKLRGLLDLISEDDFNTRSYGLLEAMLFLGIGFIDCDNDFIQQATQRGNLRTIVALRRKLPNVLDQFIMEILYPFTGLRLSPPKEMGSFAQVDLSDAIIAVYNACKDAGQLTAALLNHLTVYRAGILVPQMFILAQERGLALVGLLEMLNTTLDDLMAKHFIYINFLGASAAFNERGLVTLVRGLLSVSGELNKDLFEQGCTYIERQDAFPPEFMVRCAVAAGRTVDVAAAALPAVLPAAQLVADGAAGAAGAAAAAPLAATGFRP